MNSQEIKEKSRKTFDKEAKNYSQTSDGKFCRRVYPAILDALEKTKAVSLLDVGCGTGNILAQIQGEKALFGIDLSPQMIEAAKQNLGQKATVVVGDAEKLPWNNSMFDTVCCTFSFHHYPNPLNVLKEMQRVLKPGGFLVLADPWMLSPARQILHFTFRYSSQGDCACYGKSDMRSLLQKSGFTLKTWDHPTHDSFLLTAQKKQDE
jgi:ubiquinone/menaquinone biosynthesis C-methylase UbiE